MAVMCVISGVVLLIMDNARRTAIDTKLIRDVANINRAIQMYRIQGGSLTGLSQAQDVIDRMKAGLDTGSPDQMPRPGNNLIDPRLDIRLQTSMEASSNEQRAYYIPNQRIFVIATSGGQGIKDFVLNESLALKNYGEQNRQHPFEMGSQRDLGRNFQNVGSAHKIASRIPRFPTPQVSVGSARVSADFSGSDRSTPSEAVKSQPAAATSIDGTSNTPSFNASSILQFLNNAGSRMPVDSAFKATTCSQALDDSQVSDARDEIQTTSTPLGIFDHPITDELK